MNDEQWEQDFDTLIGKPISGERIKQFIRELLKQKKYEAGATNPPISTL